MRDGILSPRRANRLPVMLDMPLGRKIAGATEPGEVGRPGHTFNTIDKTIPTGLSVSKST